MDKLKKSKFGPIVKNTSFIKITTAKTQKVLGTILLPGNYFLFIHLSLSFMAVIASQTAKLRLFEFQT